MKLTTKQLKQLEPILASAFVLASASRSQRRSCAAFIVRWRGGVPTIVSSGVNGTPVGEDNTCENADLTVTLPHVIHAEINAVRGSLMPLMASSVLVCTDSPCPNCLEYIKKHTAMKNVVYGREYRETEHLTGLDFYHIPMDSIRARIDEGIARINQVIANAPPVVNL